MVKKAQVSADDLGVSAGLMGHVRRLLMSRQLVIDMHIARFITTKAIKRGSSEIEGI